MQDESRPRRERNMTEKGYSYLFPLKRNRLETYFELITKHATKLAPLLSDPTKIDEVRQGHKRYLSLYSSYLEIKEDISAVIQNEDLMEFDSLVASHMPVITQTKAEIEKYLTDNEVPQQRTKTKSEVSSLSSVASQTLLEEKQKEAELMTRFEALKEKTVLDLAELQLEARKEELELKTQINISRAKTRVLIENINESFVEDKGDVEYEQENTTDDQTNKQEHHPYKTQLPSSSHHQPPINPMNQPPINPMNQPPNNPMNQPPIHPPNQPPIHPPSQPPIHPPSQPPIHPPSQPPIHPPSQPPNQPPSQPPLHPPNQPLSHPPSQHSMQPLSHPPSQHSMQPLSHPPSQSSMQPLSHPPSQPSVQPLSHPPSQPSMQPLSHLPPLHPPSQQPSHPPHHPQQDSSQYSSNMPAAYRTFEAMIKNLRKPPPDIEKFSGNVLDYRRFKRQFSTKIEANCETDDEKLQYLDQFTEGDAKGIVRGYTYLSSTSGFNAALKELDDRYGNPEIIARTFTRKALNWPTIRADDSKMLDQFSIFLAECEHAILDFEDFHILQHPDTLRSLVMKLPFCYHDRWRGVVERKRPQHVTFSDFSKFVKCEARKARDPTFGREALKTASPSTSLRPSSRQNTDRKGNFQREKSFVTDLKTSCLYCTGSHHLNSCYKFLSYSVPERLQFMKTKGICFRCSTKGHMARDCPETARCDKCSRNHQTILHIDRPSRGPEPAQKTESSAWANVSRDKPQSHMEAGECTLAVIPVKVAMDNGLKTIDTYAFLDTGSTATFCTENLLRRLGCKGKQVDITLDTMGEPYIMKSQAVRGLQVCDMDMNNLINLPVVYSKKTIPVTRRHKPTTKDLQRWPHLSDIEIIEIEANIDLVIGNNVPDAYTPLELRRGPQGTPHATKTALGWTVWNMTRPCNEETALSCMRTDVIAVQELEELKKIETMMKKNMNYDFPERTIDDKKELSGEDKKFVKIVEESIELDQGQYFIRLPFKTEDTVMPDNSEIALKRLNSLKKKLRQNEDFHNDYTDFMKNIINKGYAEKVPADELEGQEGKKWYIPHHGVHHPHKPKKKRVVFDCTAAQQGVSLNNIMLQGPNLTNNLVGILLRFRQAPYAVMGDIESMFYRVRVPKEDVDFQRFYWYPEGDINRQPVVYRMLVHMFGTVSSPSCATYALRQTFEDNAESFEEETIEVAKKSFYVDDFLASKEEEDEAKELVKDMTELCSRGGFRLTKWISNSHDVVKSIPLEERAKNVKMLNLECEELPSERALGVFWTIESDALSFRLSEKRQPNTRRGILSITSSVFDPLGFAGPFILLAKQLLQRLCKLKYGWDEEIEETHLKVWKQWKQELPLLENLKLERCYKPKDFGLVLTCQLHVFCDASEQGYGVVAYLRFENTRSKVHCSLLMAKSRVAPLKKITIPRMELAAAAVGVRLYKVITEELQYTIDKTVFWTDSYSVLRYIANETTRFKTFVANRVALIKEATDPDQWRYVKSGDNPADCASRGVSIKKLLYDTQWVNGPTFLYKAEEDWKKIEEDYTLPDDDPEVKKVAMGVATEEFDPLEKLIQHYSGWKRLVKAVGWLILIRKRLLKKKEENVPEVVLTTEILKQAEDVLISHCQRQNFKTEFAVLKEKEDEKVAKEVNKSSPLRKLDPILQDDIIRVGGRIGNADVPFDCKHPIILPKNSHISRLILEDVHRAVGHQGRNAILSHVRQKYWILGANMTVKSIMSRCVVCRKYRASTMSQKMSDLPKERLQADEPPFSHVGMDYFGPILVKRGRSSVKRYGVVFTCLTMRAIHLEMASSLDTDSCINAVRRFIARRGTPKSIRSDNGTNLVGCKRELEEELRRWNQTKMQSAMLRAGIDWVFNPPGASHHGGIWERMIRSVRQILHSLMSEQSVKLDDESLCTLLCEVEAILNNRPITDVRTILKIQFH